MNTSSRIYVAGHFGMVGQAFMRALRAQGYTNLITCDLCELDLRNPYTTNTFFAHKHPDVVILAAAKVGGIKANADQPVEFLIDNLRIQNNVIEAAHYSGVEKLLFLGSSCIYPKHAPQPIPESALLTGALEPTNDSYAIAKIAGIKLCQAYAREYGDNFISVMPTNMYGPHDNFHPQTSHVIPGLFRRVRDAIASNAEEVVVWGTGTPRREFLHVDDCVSACLTLLQNYNSPEIINVGCGVDISIRELAELICDIAGFDGKLVFDSSKPDGTPRKLLDITKLSAYWEPPISLYYGLEQTYDWFIKNIP